MEAAAIIKGTPKLEAAKQLLDFAATEQANALYNKSFAVVAIPDVAQPRAGYPADIKGQMIDNDFSWAARERNAILAQWSASFDGKTEAKQ